MASFARSAKIDKIIVRNPEDTKDQDLTPQVGPIAFYEDMIDASFHAEVMIFDTFGWLESFPIRSGSKVYLRIEHPTSNIDFEKEPLYISNIKSAGQTDKKEFFVMQLESKAAFNNHLTRLYKKYNAPTNEVVKDILENDLEVPDNRVLELEEPSNKIEFLGVYKRPLQTCVGLAVKSIPSNHSKKEVSKGGSGMFFWETIKGFRFQSPDNIFKKALENKGEVITYKKATSFNALDPENNFHMTSEPIWQNNHNLFEKLAMGQYTSHFGLFDSSSREHVVIERDSLAKHDYNADKDGDILSNSEYFQPKEFSSVPSRHMLLVKDERLFDNSDEQDDSSKTSMEHVEYEARRQSRYSALFSQSLEVTVPLNLSLHAGAVVNLKFPRINIDKPSGGDNNPASGFYMIKTLSHKFGSEGDFTGIQLVRDAYTKLS
tara:strand:+ start:1090 stop:2385 length:1296 start_codon:yes stop_codon:yes gene_type:complete